MEFFFIKKQYILLIPPANKPNCLSSCFRKQDYRSFKNYGSLLQLKNFLTPPVNKPNRLSSRFGKLNFLHFIFSNILHFGTYP